MLLPSSPRLRRRLLGVALAFVAVAAAVAAVALLPEAKQRPERFSQEPAQLYDPSAQVDTISRTDRRQIDRTLTRFVSDGMGRRDPAAAYRLASPTLRAGATVADWRAGKIPVYPYTARPGSTRGWSRG